MVATERDTAYQKSDEEMLRVKACEHIACGDEGWQKLSNECPSTKAVSCLRVAFEQAEAARDRYAAVIEYDWSVKRNAGPPPNYRQDAMEAITLHRAKQEKEQGQ